MRPAVSTIGAIALVCLVVPQGLAAAAPNRQPHVTYQKVDVRDGTVQLAVARPAKRAKGPALLILHGTHGFAENYVEIAREVARSGYIAVAACWFAPGAGPGLRFVTPKACPASAPKILRGDEPDAQQRIAAIADAVARLPGVDNGRVVVMGHSRGAGAAMYFMLGGGRAEGVILNSGPYPPDAIERASRMVAPVLVLHGEKDGPSDGGSEMTSPVRAHAFVSAIQNAGRPVTAEFYPRGGHNSVFIDAVQHREVVTAIVEFLDRLSRGRRN